jgi:glutamate--cysteine ligase
MSYEAMSTGRSTFPCISSSAARSITTSPAPPSATCWPASLPQLPGERATISDWANHLSTLFPEVRLKRFLEMRGADAGPPEHAERAAGLLGRTALRPGALDGAWDLVKGWSDGERQALRDAVPKQGLAAVIAGRTLQDLAGDVLALSRAGLARRARKNAKGQDEAMFLDPLNEIIGTRRTLSQQLATAYETDWNGQITPVFDRFAI